MARRTVSIIGFGATAAVLLLIIIIGVLFLAPDVNIFGVSSVTARQTYMTYHAEHNPGVRDLLFSRNIMIESNYIPVTINVRKSRQFDELSIQVWEDSRGLSFNSVQRTRVEWSQVLVEREHENGTVYSEVFHRVRIIEPSGIVWRGDDGVMIHLPATDANERERSGYNFILNTGRSNVTFTSDSDQIVYENPLNVGTLEVRNASGVINLPAAPAEGMAAAFHVEVDNVLVDTRAVTLNCLSPVKYDVRIKSDAGVFNFMDIGRDVFVEGRTNADAGVNRVTVDGSKIGVGGNVTVRGFNVVFNQSSRSGAVGGNVDFRASNGSITVAGAGHVYMRTVNAHLTVSEGGKAHSINFEATGFGGVGAAQVGDVLGTSDKVWIKTVRGNVTVRRVWVDTEIESRYGVITVAFDPEIPLATTGMPSLAVRTYDGAVHASHICGVTRINVIALGQATVDARFRQVLGLSHIIYDGSTNPRRIIGNIDVRFEKDIPYCILTVERTSGAHNHINTNPPMVRTLQGQDVPVNHDLVNGAAYHINYHTRNFEDSTGNLRILTSNTFNLYAVF